MYSFVCNVAAKLHSSGVSDQIVTKIKNTRQTAIISSWNVNAVARQSAGKASH